MKKIHINNLFETARQEKIPVVDVADSVLALLARRRQPVVALLNRSLLWMGMTSSALAAGVMVAAFLTWQQNADSINEIINVVAWVAP
jgi:hypothetical protein